MTSPDERTREQLLGELASLQRRVEELALDKARLSASLRHANEQREAALAERGRSDDALGQSEERFRALAQHAPDAIIGLDSSGRVILWNDGARRIFGIAQSAARGQALCELILPEQEREALGGAMQRFLQTGEGLAVGESLEFPAVRHDGTELLAELSLSRMKFEDGWRATAIIRDTTERKRMEQELQRIDKLESLGLLAGGIAHDFNNILTAITGCIALARLRISAERPEHASLAAAAEAADRASTLTQQLLTFAKGGAPRKRAASVAAIVRDGAEFVLRGSNTRCEFVLPEDLWPVEVDVGQIDQVVSNLIINADHAMSKGGTIQVRAENVFQGQERNGSLARGKYVAITISDQGSGIAPEHLSRIFDPFFTTKVGGSGLGLATAHSIVKRHGGHISVESKPGEGTTFCVYLPASESAASVSERGPAQLRLGHERILVMDDEDAVRTTLSELLTHLGYEVQTARDGAEAWLQYQRAQDMGHPFDLVILDLTVPGGVGGEEAVAKLRAIDPDLKAVVSSGYSNAAIISDFAQYGFDAAIVKPFGLHELSTVLRKVLG